jgi:hypothetical protein
MSIQITCPNGHVLKVKDKYAGQTGMCPHCQARVYVPTPSGISDDAIVDLIGPPPAEDPDALPVHQDPRLRESSSSSSSGSSLIQAAMAARDTKICPKCKSEVRMCYDLCPYCHTYFSDQSEINRRLSSS